ncbi:MAG: hypothetical protein A3G81_15785 [Betaproteobacteria bacterium RIFCSPLOWO2_12_FULL_65_14]|nr:MAG: hypothetical protein A3G81_15785 [Betaproteobacteria bacterium RIFCSPLOWO2_12_FULL_65_14]
MPDPQLQYFPVTWPFLLLLIALFLVLAGMIAGRILRYASVRMGVGPRVMLVTLLLSLLLSYINIPIAYLPGRVVSAPAVVTYFGMEYVIPVVREWPATVLAINVGGAVIPICLSLYLMVKNALYKLSLFAVVIVAAVCYSLAEPVPGLGIAMPVFVPPLVTALTVLVLSREHAAPLAYISGSLGTLIGADLLNLGVIQALGAPVASIGGAGTFDGIFVTALLAVILASFATRHDVRSSSS